jgi:hypothetical protein
VLVAAGAIVIPGALSAGADTIQVAAGGQPPGQRSADGNAATETAIFQPRSVRALRGGGFVWTEPAQGIVRIASADGLVSTVAGTGKPGFSGDGGPAAEARLRRPQDASSTADGGILIADTSNNRIRLVDKKGAIKTVAGNGKGAYGGDGGPATAASLSRPVGVAALPDGGFLIADTGSRRVRRVAADGTIATVVGTGRAGPPGDGGPATSAVLIAPVRVSMTLDGGFLVVDAGSHTVRKVRPDGIIVAVAGTGTRGFSGDGGAATAARLADPSDAAVLADGSIAIADGGNNRVRRVSPDGVITTMAGTGTAGTGGVGGVPVEAQLGAPRGVAAAEGGLLLADEQTNRILFVGATPRPRNTSAPKVDGSGTVGQNVVANAGGWNGLAPTFAYAWLRCSGKTCAPIVGATRRTYRVRRTDFGSTLRVRVTATNAGGSASALSTAGAVGTLVTQTFTLRRPQEDGDLRRVYGPGAVVSKVVAYGAGKSISVVRSRLSATKWVASVGLFLLDTSSLPDNVELESVALALLVRSVHSEDRLRLLVHSCPGSWPPVEGDYRPVAPAGPDARLPLAPLKAGVAKVTLPASAISKTGATRLCLSISGHVPRAKNAVAIAAADAGTDTAPRLVVTFRTPTAKP